MDTLATSFLGPFDQPAGGLAKPISPPMTNSSTRTDTGLRAMPTMWSNHPSCSTASPMAWSGRSDVTRLANWLAQPTTR
jgi:hypothetical protein